MRLALALCLLPSLAFAADLPIRPDLNITPGVVNPEVTAEMVCTRGFAQTQRHTAGSLKERVYKAYHIDRKLQCMHGTCEIDHLVSLELGGADVFENLWPESYDTQPYNAHHKDRLENHLHTLVCHGTITLQEAQQEIITDWIAAYRKYIDPDAPDV